MAEKTTTIEEKTNGKNKKFKIKEGF